MSGTARLQVRAFAPYPGTGPSTRFRLLQFVEPLSQRGVDLEIVPFVEEADYEGLYDSGGWLKKSALLLESIFRRFRSVGGADGADVAVVQRELAPVLNAVLRKRLRSSGVPLIYDFDDAVHLRPEGGNRFLARLRRPEAATAGFCRGADIVLAGNPYLAAFAREARGSADGGRRRAEEGVQVLPTVIDTDRFVPDQPDPKRDVPVVGWIGTHTTAPYLARLYPALVQARRRVSFRVLVVSNRPPPRVEGLEVEFRRWSAEREVEQVRELDVGLYPLPDDPWARGKCGFKAIQYLACGVPVVASPVGVLPEIVVDGETGILASEPREWVGALELLSADPSRRRELGHRGREHVVSRYSVASVVERLAAAIKTVAEGVA